MISREQTTKLMEEYILNSSLRNHSMMVAKAMEAYAKSLNLSDLEIEIWWSAGLLHDLDWEKFPDEHPNKAINDILPQLGYDNQITDAIAAHAPDRTGKKPETTLQKYLFACDEICGFINAVSLIRPTGFVGMEPKSVLKRLKEKSFAANVSREDITHGAELIEKTLEEHVGFLIKVFG